MLYLKVYSNKQRISQKTTQIDRKQYNKTELTKIEQQLARGSSEFKSSGSTTQVTFLNPESQNSPDDPILM